MWLLTFVCRYGSDITSSWPVSGKFSPKQKAVYEGVLSAYQTIKSAMKPGVSWPVSDEYSSLFAVFYSPC